MRLLRWILFSVLVSLIPLALHAVILLTQSAPLAGIPSSVLAGGELLLISTAIAADAIGDLVATGVQNELGKVLSGGLCVISLLFAALWYAANSIMMDMGKAGNGTVVAAGSAVIFVVTVAASGGCKRLTGNS